MSKSQRKAEEKAACAKRKQKRKLTPAQRQAKRERKKNFMWIFINGKQKRVRRPQLIEGLTVDEFIARNADPIWLHQNEMWELMPSDENEDTARSGDPIEFREDENPESMSYDDEIPF